MPSSLGFDPKSLKQKIEMWLQGRLGDATTSRSRISMRPTDDGSLLRDRDVRRGVDRRTATVVTKNLVLRTAPSGHVVFPTYDLGLQYEVMSRVGANSEVADARRCAGTSPTRPSIGGEFLVMGAGRGGGAAGPHAVHDAGLAARVVARGPEDPADLGRRDAGRPPCHRLARRRTRHSRPAPVRRHRARPAARLLRGVPRVGTGRSPPAPAARGGTMAAGQHPRPGAGTGPELGRLADRQHDVRRLTDPWPCSTGRWRPSARRGRPGLVLPVRALLLRRDRRGEPAGLPAHRRVVAHYEQTAGHPVERPRLVHGVGCVPLRRRVHATRSGRWRWPRWRRSRRTTTPPPRSWSTCSPRSPDVHGPTRDTTTRSVRLSQFGDTRSSAQHHALLMELPSSGGAIAHS